jgi:dihydrolipoamide dehydrogenase
MDYSAVPAAVFTSPEVATVGLTEAQAREKGFKRGLPPEQLPRTGQGPGHGRTGGRVQARRRRADSGRLLGAHLAGAHVSDIIAEPTLAPAARRQGARPGKTIHAHPTLAEGLFETAHLL